MGGCSPKNARTSKVQAHDVLDVLRALKAAGSRAWLDGGWGVDALLGEQTRDHEDVDIFVELDRIDDVLDAVEPLGLRLAEDYLPTRAVLRSSCSPGRHPPIENAPGFWAQGANQHFQMWVLDVDGTRLVIAAYSFPSTSPQDRAALDEVLASIQIG